MSKYNRKIVEREKIDPPSTPVHEHSLSWLGTGTSIKSGRIKLVLWSQIFQIQSFWTKYGSDFVVFVICYANFIDLFFN